MSNTKTIVFKSHHQTDVVMAGLDLLDVQTENDLERERARGEFADDELISYYERRLTRIVEARRNLLGMVAEAA